MIPELHITDHIILKIGTLLISLVSNSCSENTGNHYKYSTTDSTVVYAQRFKLNRTDSCTILTITDPWQGAGDIIQEYYLVRREFQNELSADPSKIITVPVKKIICMSTTHVAMVHALGQEKTIVAVSGADLIYNEDISDRIRKGRINDIGYDSGLNSELIINSSPDLVMIYGIGSESAGYTARINDLGTKVMYNADYLETDPLGKAEWIKVFGAIFSMEEKADSIFNGISKSYISLKNIIHGEIDTKPVVLLGMPFRDTWYISPGNSYISQLISDAGGSYLWENTESSFSMPYSLESVFIRALKADIWLNTGSLTSKRDIILLDPRLGSLPPFVNDKLYNNDRRLNGSGGNDYWESGCINPQIILKDIAAILHPGIFPGYQPVYYRKVD